jgi:prepilin-type N-terminal cleavage/methylation domain-containing protein
MGRRKAFTLVELLISMTIFAMLIVTVYESLMTLIVANMRTDTMRSVQAEARDIVAFMTRDIKNPNLQKIEINNDKLILRFPEEATHTYEVFSDINGSYLQYTDSNGSVNLTTSNIKVIAGKPKEGGPKKAFESDSESDGRFVSINLLFELTRGLKNYQMTVETTLAR